MTPGCDLNFKVWAWVVRMTRCFAKKNIRTTSFGYYVYDSFYGKNCTGSEKNVLCIPGMFISEKYRSLWSDAAHDAFDICHSIKAGFHRLRHIGKQGPEDSTFGDSGCYRSRRRQGPVNFGRTGSFGSTVGYSLHWRDNIPSMHSKTYESLILILRSTLLDGLFDTWLF